MTAPTPVSDHDHHLGDSDRDSHSHSHGSRTWRVGELAAESGLTVRTLHHYDRIGLLRPSRRGPGGHRRYTAEDVATLYRIVALRQLGLPLDQIPAALRAGDPRTLLADQLDHLDKHIAAAQRLRTQLSAVLTNLRGREAQPDVDDLVRLLRGTTDVEQAVARQLTDAQLEALRARHAELGERARHAVAVELPELYLRAQAELDAGTDPTDPRVRVIVDRIDEVSAELSGGDDAASARTRAAWADQGGYRELSDYVARARSSRA
ncbi:MerR family transcriptional regulator [Frankia canadensis]|uniref:MerR family transcriptional regulator n=1 Tax=Frankia canadensis TaxID=1836972 RepID=A0A2I2L077_9ACTN|nr:MerR family transcriptional regulator [Frankia canadensis]SNQ51318.1 MerR family transcriptional regulator [Frankia canadensis]SOU58608.1 MerR family transcriptional regulator [Frankia canadensis]